MAKLRDNQRDLEPQGDDGKDHLRAMYADPERYAAWRQGLTLAPPPGISDAHNRHVGRLMVEAEFIKNSSGNPAMRARLAALFAGLSDSCKGPDLHGPLKRPTNAKPTDARDAERSKIEAEARLSELQDAYRESPPAPLPKEAFERVEF